jgi:micrococcal nuclease
VFQATRLQPSRLAALLAALACLNFASPAVAETFEAQCVKVNDGDSFVVKLGQGKRQVRLLGIDAPKMGQKPWGLASRRFLEKLVLNKTLRLETDTLATDKHGRMLAYVFVGSRFINKEIISNGQAIASNIPPNEQYKQELGAAQSVARSAGMGIWDPKHHIDILPSDYRHQR